MAFKKGRTPPSVERAKTTLILLANSTPSAAKKIIKNANSTVLKAISELSLNMLNGVVKLTPARKRRLKKYKNIMQKISEKKVKIADRRKLIQRGGFVSELLRALCPRVMKGMSALVKHICSKSREKRRRLLGKKKL